MYVVRAAREGGYIVLSIDQSAPRRRLTGGRFERRWDRIDGAFRAAKTLAGWDHYGGGVVEYDGAEAVEGWERQCEISRFRRLNAPPS